MSADSFSVDFEPTAAFAGHESAKELWSRQRPLPSFSPIGRGTLIANRRMSFPRVHSHCAPSASRDQSQGSRPLNQDSLFTFEQVIASCHGEIAYFSRLLRELHGEAELCTVDGIVMPLHAKRHDDGTFHAMAGGVTPIASEHIDEETCASIFDAQDRLFATLRLRTGDMDPSASLDRLLRALVQTVAGAITERWFRLHHRLHWIVAAQRQDRAESINGSDTSAAVRPHNQLLSFKIRDLGV